jgi:hypothetical protein
MENRRLESPYCTAQLEFVHEKGWWLSNMSARPIGLFHDETATAFMLADKGSGWWVLLPWDWYPTVVEQIGKTCLEPLIIGWEHVRNH